MSQKVVNFENEVESVNLITGETSSEFEDAVEGTLGNSVYCTTGDTVEDTFEESLIWWNSLGDKMRRFFVTLNHGLFREVSSKSHHVRELGRVESLMQKKIESEIIRVRREEGERATDLILEKEEKFRKDLAELSSKHSAERAKLEGEISALEGRLSDEKIFMLERYNREILELKEKFEGEKNILMTDKSLRDHSEELVERIADVMRNEVLRSELESKAETNFSKGDRGEKKVHDLIFSKYASCDISDVANLKGGGDLQFCVDGERIMCEVKNVSQSSMSGSYKKYRSQVHEHLKDLNAKDPSSRTAILCSMQNVKFKGGKISDFELIEGKDGRKLFVAYCSDVDRNPEHFYLCVESCKIVSGLLDETNNHSGDGLSETEKKLHNLIQRVESAGRQLVDTLDRLDEDAKLIERLRTSNQKKRDAVQDLMGLLSLE